MRGSILLLTLLAASCLAKAQNTLLPVFAYQQVQHTQVVAAQSLPQLLAPKVLHMRNSIADEVASFSENNLVTSLLPSLSAVEDCGTYSIALYNTLVKLKQAQTYYQQGLYEKAIQVYESIPNSALSNQQIVAKNFELGYSYLQHNKKAQKTIHSHQKVLACMNAIRSISGDYKDAGNYYSAALNYLDANYTEALRSIESVLQHPQYKDVAALIQAQSLFELGRVTEAENAIAVFFTNKNISTRYAAQMVQLAMHLAYEQGDYQRVVEYGNKVGDVMAMSEAQRYIYAYSKQQMLDYEVAKLCYKSLLASENDTMSSYSYYHLAQLAMLEGNNNEALSRLRFIADDAPLSSAMSADICLLISQLSYNAKDYYTSMRYSARSIKSGKAYTAKAIEVLTEALPQLQPIDSALHYLRNYQTYEPIRQKLIEVLAQQIVQNYNQQQLSVALEQFNEYVQLKGYIDANDYYTLALINYASNDYSGFIQAYEKAAIPNAEHCKLYWMNIRALLLNQKLEEAVSRFESVQDSACIDGVYEANVHQVLKCKQFLQQRDSIFNTNVQTLASSPDMWKISKSSLDSLLSLNYCTSKHKDIIRLAYCKQAASRGTVDTSVLHQIDFASFNKIALNNYVALCTEVRHMSLPYMAFTLPDSITYTDAHEYKLQLSLAQYALIRNDKNRAKEIYTCLLQSAIKDEQRKKIQSKLKAIK